MSHHFEYINDKPDINGAEIVARLEQQTSVNSSHVYGLAPSEQKVTSTVLYWSTGEQLIVVLRTVQ